MILRTSVACLLLFGHEVELDGAAFHKIGCRTGGRRALVRGLPAFL